MQFGIDHVRRYFSGSSRVVQRDDNDHVISVQLTALKGQKTATSRGTSWSSTSTRKPSSWAAHLRQAARARTHRRGRRGRSDGRQRPDDVVVG